MCLQVFSSWWIETKVGRSPVSVLFNWHHDCPFKFISIPFTLNKQTISLHCSSCLDNYSPMNKQSIANGDSIEVIARRLVGCCRVGCVCGQTFSLFCLFTCFVVSLHLFDRGCVHFIATASTAINLSIQFTYILIRWHSVCVFRIRKCVLSIISSWLIIL